MLRTMLTRDVTLVVCLLVPGMVQNDNCGTWGMAAFDPRQIELRVRIFF